MYCILTNYQLASLVSAIATADENSKEILQKVILLVAYDCKCEPYMQAAFTEHCKYVKRQQCHYVYVMNRC